MTEKLIETNLLNSSGAVINPAVEEKQDQIVGILTELADGGSAYYNTKSAVPPGVWTTVLEFTPTKKIKLVRFYMTGTADAKCLLYIDGNPILQARNSVAKKDFDISFLGSELKLNGSSSIEIKVYHWGVGLQEYSATIFMKDRNS